VSSFFRIHRDEEFNEIEFQPLTGKKTFFPVLVVDEEFSQEFQFRFFDGGIPAKHFWINRRWISKKSIKFYVFFNLLKITKILSDFWEESNSEMLQRYPAIKKSELKFYTKFFIHHRTGKKFFFPARGWNSILINSSSLSILKKLRKWGI
jgi:hypothetical protein